MYTLYFSHYFDVGFSVVLVPHLDLASLESGYHGLVKENETLVEVTPRIKAVGGEICSFRIVNKHHGEAPFEVRLNFVFQLCTGIFIQLLTFWTLSIIQNNILEVGVCIYP